jgi:hypothetical protein
MKSYVYTCSASSERAHDNLRRSAVQGGVSGWTGHTCKDAKRHLRPEELLAWKSHLALSAGTEMAVTTTASLGFSIESGLDRQRITLERSKREVGIGRVLTADSNGSALWFSALGILIVIEDDTWLCAGLEASWSVFK